MRLLCGGAIAYWLAHIINPSFVAIAVMIVLFIPLFIADNLFFEQPEMIPHPDNSHHPAHQPAQKTSGKKDQNKPSSIQLLKMENESKDKESPKARLTK
jgi:hypothetical protein